LVPIGQFDNPLLVLFVLNDVGRFLWDLIDGSCSGEEIIENLTEKYEVKKECAKRDVEAFLSLLCDKNLISIR